MKISTIKKKKEKNESRKKILEKRRTLSEEYKNESDKKIFENLISLTELQKSKTIFCYVGTREEINTLPIIEYLLGQGRTVAVPLCLSKGIMEAKVLGSVSELSKGRFGIMEPSKLAKTLPPEELDLSIVPCVSANLRGSRLGYGAGFYDRFLQKSSSTKIILCRKKLLLKEIPIEPHDIPMDIVVTEEEIVKL